MAEARNPTRRARLTIQLGIGAVLLIVAAWLLSSIAKDVVTGDRLTLLDERVAQWLRLHASVVVTRWRSLVPQLQSIVVMSFYTSIVGILAFRV